MEKDLFMRACKNGDQSIVASLVQSMALNDILSGFIIASNNGHACIISCIFDSGFVIPKEFAIEQLLFNVCKLGFHDIVELLFKNGAKITDFYIYDSPFINAQVLRVLIIYGLDLETAKELLKITVFKSLKLTFENNKRPLLDKHIESIQLLIDTYHFTPDNIPQIRIHNYLKF